MMGIRRINVKKTTLRSRYPSLSDDPAGCDKHRANDFDDFFEEGSQKNEGAADEDDGILQSVFPNLAPVFCPCSMLLSSV